MPATMDSLTKLIATHSLAVLAGAAAAAGIAAMVMSREVSEKAVHATHKVDKILAERGIATVPRRHTKA